jgi:hypothetical protein
MDRRAGRLAVFGIVVVLLLGVTARIWWVNTSYPTIDLEYYEMGEWVALDGAFQDGTTSENTRDYSLMVESAEVMTYDEYLEKYGVEASGTHGDARCVVDVTLRIRNDGTEQGGINIFQMVLTPVRGNEYLICDVMNEDALWPQVEAGADSSVSIRPGTEYVTHIPYVFNGGTEVYEREIMDTEFTLLASRMPVRKMIKVSVE